MSVVGDPVGIEYEGRVYIPKPLSAGDRVIVSKLGRRIYSPIVTMTYGFNVTNGKMTITPIKITSPSQFQLQTIMKIP